MSNRDVVEGSSKSLNKTIKEIKRFMGDSAKRPQDVKLREYLYEKLADFGEDWYKRGFRRGHMTRPDLWEKYDTRDNNESISKYLHHCTEQRVERRPPWQVNAMYDELRPIIEKFESLLPEYKPATELLTRTRGVASLDGFSTAAIRTFDSGIFPEK
jgi:hypothetical protein